MSVRQRIEIPADSPLFSGHFPGHPILPGIAHPLLVARALAAEHIAAIPFLKLRGTVLPGDILEASVTGPNEEGAVRFDLRRGDEAISQGALRLGPPEAAVLHLGAIAPGPETFPPVSTLVPHAPPALLILDVLEAAADRLTARAEIPEASPFVTAGRAPAFLSLEAAAQGAAVLEALSRRDGSGPRIGYLVGLRDARCETAWLPAGQPFRITVRSAGGAAALSIYEAVVETADRSQIARGTLSTFAPHDLHGRIIITPPPKVAA
jgi:predicted hotdog family 3-hydroxylacyl-ACP dehydratase